MAVLGYISTLTLSMFMRPGLNFGSAKSARNLPRLLTSPSYSVLMKRSPITLAIALASRLTCAWFHMRSSAMMLAASGAGLDVCALGGWAWGVLARGQR